MTKRIAQINLVTMEKEFPSWLRNAVGDKTRREGLSREGNVLLACADTFFRAALARRLRDHAFTVDEAETGKQAVSRWIEGSYDVALLDLDLPEGDGSWTGQAIRMLDPEARIAFLSPGTGTAVSRAAHVAGGVS